MFNLSSENFTDKFKAFTNKFLLYSPYLFPFIISFIFFEKHSLCNDVYFDADTAEIPQQIGTIFAYYDIVKHPIFYSISFFLYRLIKIFLPFLSEENISKLVLISYQTLLIYTLNKFIENFFFKNQIFKICLNFLLSFSICFFIVFLPETFGLSLSITILMLLYLAKVNPRVNNSRYRYFINAIVFGFSSLVSINILGLGLAYIAIPVVAKYKFINQKIEEFKARIIELIIALSIGMTPFILIRLVNKQDDFASYVSNWSSLSNFLSIKTWLLTFTNIFSFGFISPIDQIVRKYEFNMVLSPLGFLSLLFGIFVFITLTISFLKAVSYYRNIAFLDKKVIRNWDSEMSFYIFIYGISQLLFFIYWAPQDSILFSTYIAPLFMIKSIHILDNYISIFKLKILSYFFIFFTMFYVSINSAVFAKTLNKNLPNNCKDWGVVNIVIPRN